MGRPREDVTLKTRSHGERQGRHTNHKIRTQVKRLLNQQVLRAVYDFLAGYLHFSNSSKSVLIRRDDSTFM